MGGFPRVVLRDPTEVESWYALSTDRFLEVSTYLSYWNTKFEE